MAARQSALLRLTQFGASLALGASLLAFAPEARALSPFLEIPDQADAMKTPAYRYANMTNDEAYAELDRRGILYNREKPIAGVRAPIRLTGRLHGVLIRSALPAEKRATTMVEILDARLALSLDDFTAILEKHDVNELVHYTMYRPNVAKPEDASDTKADDAAKPAPEKPIARVGRASRPSKHRAFSKAAKASKQKAQAPSTSHKKTAGEGDLLEKGLAGLDDVSDDLPHASFDLTGGEVGAKTPKQARKRTATKIPAANHGKGTSKGVAPKLAVSTPTEAEIDDDKPQPKWAPPGTRHPAGLAIDVGILIKKDGTQLSIAGNFDGSIGDKTCGAGAPSPSSPKAKELRSIVCEAHDEGVFTYTLTPNFDVAHKDHFHMEIKPGVTWFLYH